MFAQLGYHHQLRENFSVGQLLKGTAVLAALLLVILFWQPIWDLLRIIGNRQAVVAYLDQFGATAPVLLSLIIVLQIIVAAVPGHALLFASGYIYGFWGGFGINLLTLVLGSQVAYLLARWAGRPLVERLTPVETLDKLYAAANQKGLLFFMFAFMLPIFPVDVMNYAAGLSGISGRRFFVANFIGRLPTVIVTTAIGAFGFQLSAKTWLVIVPAGIVMFLAWRKFLAKS